MLARAARSARLTAHFDLDFPKAPRREPYWCHKHRRTCRPVGEARKFLVRYLEDTLTRIEEFDRVRDRARTAEVVHGDARELSLEGPLDAVLTSPPYPGLIDYHEQHAYAFELLGLERRDADEIGRGVRGYCEDVAAVLRRARRALRRGGRIVIVVNDSRGLYPEIVERAGLRLEQRLTRHVNRRTGRRAGQFFEDVLVCRTGCR